MDPDRESRDQKEQNKRARGEDPNQEEDLHGKGLNQGLPKGQQVCFLSLSPSITASFRPSLSNIACICERGVVRLESSFGPKYIMWQKLLLGFGSKIEQSKSKGSTGIVEKSRMSNGTFIKRNKPILRSEDEDHHAPDATGKLKKGRKYAINDMENSGFNL